MDSTWLLVFAITTFIISILYFYLFSRKQEKFMQFWGLSWVAYSCSLLCLLLYFASPADLFLEIRKVIDLVNVLLLLFGTYAFMHTKTPDYWYRFSLYMMLLAAVCMIYDFGLLSFYLPISIYQIIITICICFHIFHKWNVPRGEKVISSTVFLIWGIGKALLSIVEIFTDLEYNLYITELLISHLVNFCILTIYIVYTKNENNLVDNLYKTVVENSKDVIFYYKLIPYESFWYVSPSIQEVTGFSPNDLYSNPKFYRNMAIADNSGSINDMFSPESPIKKSAILELSKKDGETFWAELTCTPICGDGESPAALIGTLRDVTQVKTAEMESREAAHSRSRILSYISHELRTPLTSMIGYVTALNDDTLDTPGKRKEAMEIITAKTFMLKKMIDDLDQLTKMESHQFTFDFNAYTADEAAQIMIDSTLNDIRNAGFDAEIQQDALTLKRHWVVMDSDRINQVFTNLITNAMKNSREHKKLELKFEIDDNIENFIVTVKDYGIGIKDSEIPFIFERFYRVKNAGSPRLSSEGRGLGLTLCKEIIAAHQGNIYAESVYGAGSTFTFIIPLLEEES